jgi:hypothetical protein
MTLSALGWLPEGMNTGGIPFEGPLPVEYIGVYHEGGDGTFIGVTELDFRQIAVIFESSFIRERFGYSASPINGDYEPMLRIELVQDGVFGVLLLDSFTPPAIAAEFFEFPAYVQDACVGGITATTPIYGSCASGTVVAATDIEGTVPIFTEES